MTKALKKLVPYSAVVWLLLAVSARDAAAQISVEHLRIQNSPDVRGWEPTATITKVEFWHGAGIHFEFDRNATPAERRKLDAQVRAREIDGYLWLTREAMANSKVDFCAGSTSNFLETEQIRQATTVVAVAYRLQLRGIQNLDTASLLHEVEVRVIQVRATQTCCREIGAAEVRSYLSMLCSPRIPGLNPHLEQCEVLPICH